MSGILRTGPSLWLSGQLKPSGIPKIDWTHPLAFRLVSYWIDTGSGFYVDLVTGQLTTKTATGGTTAPGRAATPWGTAFNFNATLTEQADPNVGSVQSWTAPYSVAVGCVSRGAPNMGTGNAFWFGLLDASGNGPAGVYFPTSTTFGIGYGNVASPFSFTFSQNVFYVIVGAATGTTTQSSWVNGIAQTAGTATSAFSGSAMHYTFNPNSGLYNTSGNPTFNNGSVFFAGSWSGRALTQTEATLLYNDPYCFLIPPEGEMPAIRVAAAAGNPFKQSDWPNPLPVTWRREWNASSVGYIGKDRIYDGPGKVPQYEWPNPIGRYWDIFSSQRFDLNTLKLNPFSQLDWPNPTGRYWDRFWSQSPAVKQTVPFSQFDWPTPPRVFWNIFGSQGLDLKTLGTPPFNQDDWPNPPRREWYRSWEQNLQEFFPSVVAKPFSQLDWPNPSRLNWYQDWSQRPQVPVIVYQPISIEWDLPSSVNWYRDWSQNLLELYPPVSTVPFKQLDWPNPTRREWDRFWSQSPYPVSTRPFNQYDWPLPIPPRYWDRFWSESPAVQAAIFQPSSFEWDIPKQVTWYQDWKQSPFPPPLAAVPFNQTDWPLPTRREWDRFWSQSPQVPITVYQPISIEWDLPSGSKWYLDWNQNLVLFIPTGPKPFNQQDWPNPVPPNRLDQFLGKFLQESTLAPSTAKPFLQSDWVNPQPVYWFRDFNENLILLFPPPVVTFQPLHYHQFPGSTTGTLGAMLHY